MVISVSPSTSSPFAIRYPLRPALQLAFSDRCTQPKLGHAGCLTGGSDPTNFWAAEGRQKWGRSRPFWCFFHGNFRLHRFSISHASKKLCSAPGEELGEDEAEESNSYALHLFPPNPCCARRQNTLHIDPCFHLLGWRDRHGFRGNEVGSLQPNSVPSRGHIDHSVVRNLFAFGHLLDREGEREGDA
jgi:hypothetical protein